MASPAMAYDGDREPRTADILSWPTRDTPTTHSVQGVVEGAIELDESNSIEFLGKRFRLAERVGLMPMLAFAAASKKGLDSDSMEGLAAMYALIRDCLDETRIQATNEADELVFEDDGSPRYDGQSEWQKFEAHCYEKKAEGEELMKFIGDAMSVVSARPPKRRETSSGGSPRTSPRSKAVSSLRATWPGVGDGLTDLRDLAMKDEAR